MPGTSSDGSDNLQTSGGDRPGPIAELPILLASYVAMFALSCAAGTAFLPIQGGWFFAYIVPSFWIGWRIECAFFARAADETESLTRPTTFGAMYLIPIALALVTRILGWSLWAGIGAVAALTARAIILNRRGSEVASD
jgi:hypothetical protein